MKLDRLSGAEFYGKLLRVCYNSNMLKLTSIAGDHVSFREKQYLFTQLRKGGVHLLPLPPSAAPPSGMSANKIGMFLDPVQTVGR